MRPGFFRAHRDGGDRQRRRIRRDHGIFAQNRFELGDQIALDFQLFDNRFHHHVAGGQAFQRVACLDAGQRRFAVGGADLALVGQLGEGILQVLARGGHGLRVGVVQIDSQACLRGDLRDAAAHGACANDTKRLDGGIAHCWSKKVVAKLARSYVFCSFRDRCAMHAACADRPGNAGQRTMVRSGVDTNRSPTAHTTIDITIHIIIRTSSRRETTC